jgi:hypothetical protein
VINSLLPRTVTLSNATAMWGLGRTHICELAGRGEIELIKSGSCTLPRVDSLVAYLDRCPKAAIRAKVAG